MLSNPVTPLLGKNEQRQSAGALGKARAVQDRNVQASLILWAIMAGRFGVGGSDISTHLKPYCSLLFSWRKTHLHRHALAALIWVMESRLNIMQCLS